MPDRAPTVANSVVAAVELRRLPPTAVSSDATGPAVAAVSYFAEAPIEELASEGQLEGDAGAAVSETTLAEMEAMALQHNPTLAQRLAKVEAARGRWVQVGLPPNTHVGYSGQQLGSGGQAEQHGVFIGQQFIRGCKLSLNQAAVAQEVSIAQQRYQAQRFRVMTDVRLGYYEVLLSQRRVAVAVEIEGIAKEAVRTTEALLRAQEISKIDLMRAQVERQTASVQVKNARTRNVAAWSRLSAVVGVTLTPETLPGDLTEIPSDLDEESLLAQILGSSPELTAAYAQVERARWRLQRERAEPIPDIDVQAIFQSDNGTGSSNANLQVTAPIPWLNGNQGAIREAYAELSAASRNVQRVEQSLKRRLATVYQEYAAARNQVEDYSKEGGILENSSQTLIFVRRGYEAAGELSYLDLITAQRTYAQTNLAYIEALGMLWETRIEMEGLLLKGSLEATGE